jgi:hypothetical protein
MIYKDFRLPAARTGDRQHVCRSAHNMVFHRFGLVIRIVCSRLPGITFMRGRRKIGYASYL